MTVRNEAFTNFSGGQYSPHLAGRYDSPLFRFGVEKALNVIPRPQGGFFRRPGTSTIFDSTPVASSKGIDFKVNPDESYQLVFQPAGDLLIFDDGTLSKTISNHGIPDGAVSLWTMGYVRIRDLMIFTYRYMAPKVLRAPFTVEYTGDGVEDTFAANFSFFDAGNIIVKVNGTTKTLTTHYTVSTPDLVGGQYTSATITFTGGNIPANGATIEIIRDWEWEDYPNIDGPWEPENLDKALKIKVKYAASGTVYDSTDKTFTGNIDIKAKTRKGTDDTWFDDNWVGRQLRLFQKVSNAENWGIVNITGVETTKSEFNCTVETQYPLVLADDGSTAVSPIIDNRNRRWRLSAWYTDNYPDRVSFFEGRVYFFRGNDRWASVAGDLFRFSPDTITGEEDSETYSVTADSAIYFQSGSPDSTDPEWVASTTALHIGTDSSYLTISGLGRTAGISSDNIQEKRESGIGSAPIPPIITNSIYYIDNIRQNLYKADYKFQSDSYVSEKVNNFDDEILYERVRAMALITDPYQMIWCVLNDGTVAVCVNNEVDNVYSWSTLEFSFDVWDIIVSKTADNREKVYLLDVDGNMYRLGKFRTNIGETHTKIVYSETEDGGTGYYHTVTNETEAEYLTDANTIAAADTLIDLNDIAPTQKVVDMTNYQNWNYSSVANTEVTPTHAYETGTPFYAEIILRPLNITAQGETTLPNDKRVLKVLANVWRTLDFKVKELDSNYSAQANFRRSSDDPFLPPSPFTGIKEIKGASSDKKVDIRLKIYQDQCVPFNLNSIVVEYDEEE